MAKRGWVLDPHTGGKKIPASLKERIRKRILEHAESRYSGRYNRIDVRFRAQFCYIDAFTEPHLAEGYQPPAEWQETREQMLERMRNTPTRLCRLRHFAEERWSVAFYAYSSEKYEPCILRSGEWFGTPEEGLNVGAVYLRG